MEGVRPSRLDSFLRPVHRWVWRDPLRRARKLFRFAETEADGGRDLSRAAELTADALLRRLYLRHALDEQRHAVLFRQRGRSLMNGLSSAAHDGFEANWLAPGERGLDDLHVDGARDGSLLAFLHLSEKAAAGRFAIYQEVLGSDPGTQAIFSEILRDEAFHMSYTQTQLVRMEPNKHRLRLWQARLGRLGKAYLRAAAAIAGLLGTLLLLLQYAVLLPPFALLAKRAARREPKGWTVRRQTSSMKSQY